MSKRKLLINKVFEKIKAKSDKDTKNGWATELSDDIDKKLKFTISIKTLSRYYDSYITGTKEETGIETLILNKLSEYLDYKDFADFSRTFIKNDDEANKTTVKISVDNDEGSLSEKLSNIIINITNEQNFKMPEFMKKNGMGIMEIALLICLATGSVFFSKKPEGKALGFAGILDSQLHCMYWDKSEYKPIDCKDKKPIYNHKIPFDYERMEYFKRIERKDTLTVDNAFGKVWYSKYNGEVYFFTDDGVDPNNGRELRKATEYIIDKYAGIQEEAK
ncbi:hypothetical protein NAL32_06240 [Chryseobacterium sp. Ch-15]|uniref:Uncharacterized protein n=1 Tax=Chryseobacterium muglaense TaxID=2893752 RepID=A0A9Q3UWL9_9FLAO|nr:hypothetical protein [Chryseobacterium muglaense]MBD3904340.1 hypothetical protein [Chryseobacterium muglaense]MCC9035343.1 hypothetical protein [Chryseobacterium muglaense]MCM2553992.1 hypothetical protein [Chryseobacterium muglaense]